MDFWVQWQPLCGKGLDKVLNAVFIPLIFPCVF